MIAIGLDNSGFDYYGLDISGFDYYGLDISGFVYYGLDNSGFDNYGLDNYSFDYYGLDNAGFDYHYLNNSRLENSDKDYIDACKKVESGGLKPCVEHYRGGGLRSYIPTILAQSGLTKSPLHPLLTEFILSCVGGISNFQKKTYWFTVCNGI